MRVVWLVPLLASIALAHGGSGRSTSGGGQGFGGGGVQVPGGTTTPSGQRGGAPVTITSNQRQHTWRIWWAYNREMYLAGRLRGSPVSGGLRVDANNRTTRERLRKEVITPILIDALADKNNHVRSAAAVALGKFGDPQFNRKLKRRTDAPREKWFDVKEAALYAMGLLRLEDNRKFMTQIAGDKLRPLVARSIALTSLALDKSQRSTDTLVWHLKYHRSSLRFNADQSPTVSEEDRRRFAAHLLGFVDRKFDVNGLLSRAAAGSRRWTEATQGLAITALGRRRAREYKDDLFRMAYRRDVPRAAKQSIPIALGMMLSRSDKDDIKRLAKFATDFRREPAVRHFAVMALARIGGKQCIDILRGYVNDNVFNSAEDRAFVFLALGLIGAGSNEACETLMNEYRKRKPITTRAALALALGIARHKPAIPLTIDFLNKTSLGSAPRGGGNSSGRGSSGRGGSGDVVQLRGRDFLAYGSLALGFHGSDDGLTTIREILRKYRDPKVESNAAIALVLIRRSEAIDDLKPILKDSGNAMTRGAIIMALGLVPEPKMELVKLLKAQYERDSNPDSVRAMAIVGLGALGDPRAVPMSVWFVRGYNYLIRCQALDLIARLL
jgi:HEAT repeat protein